MNENKNGPFQFENQKRPMLFGKFPIVIDSTLPRNVIKFTSPDGKTIHTIQLSENLTKP